MKSHRWPSWSVAMTLLCTFGLSAGELTVADDAGHYNLNSQLEYFLDQEQSLTQALQRQQWQAKPDDSVLNLGFTDRTVWLRTALILPEPLTRQWYLVIPYPLLEEVDLYILRGRQPPEIVHTSRQQTENQRQQAHSYQIALPLPADLHGQVTLFLRARSATSLQVPVELWREDRLLTQFATQSLYWGASLYLLNVFDVVPVNVVTSHALQVGSVAEVLLLSFALAHRIKDERARKLAALRRQQMAERQVRDLELQSLEAAMHDSTTRMPNTSLLNQQLHTLIGQRRRVALTLVHYPQIRDIASSMGHRLAEEMFVQLMNKLNHTLAGQDSVICLETRQRAYIAIPEFGSAAFLIDLHLLEQPLEPFIEQLVGRHEISVHAVRLPVLMNLHCGVAIAPDHGDGGELELYLQPQMNSSGRVLVGAEILLRWHSPRFGPVPAMEVIEIAENAGLMDLLSRYIVTQAWVTMQTLQQRHLNITCSINLSVQNLTNSQFVAFALAGIRERALPMNRVIFEVTETSMMHNMAAVIGSLLQIANSGCRIALDDFGTGYSSLAYLSRLPVHELKIDQCFISQMAASQNDLGIVQSTLKLARTLNLETVAEGVEDTDTQALLSELGCHRLQGYLFAKPMPLEAFCGWATAQI